MQDWTIKALWIGEELSLIEQLSLCSFLANGHRVELFTYGHVRGVPQGVIVRNGSEILSVDKIFKYKKRKSYSGFANWFRYEMLYKEGGVWIDTDVVCLKKFNFSEDIFFGLEDSKTVNCAVVGSLPGNPMFKMLSAQVSSPNSFLPYDTTREKRRKLIRRFLRGNQRGDVRWGETGPMGFTKALHHSNLFSCAKPITAFYPIHCSCWKAIFDETFPDPHRSFPDSYAIHLWNEMIRRDSNFDKNGPFKKCSLIHSLIEKYL